MRWSQGAAWIRPGAVGEGGVKEKGKQISREKKKQTRQTEKVK